MMTLKEFYDVFETEANGGYTIEIVWDSKYDEESLEFSHDYFFSFMQQTNLGDRKIASINMGKDKDIKITLDDEEEGE